jgi:peptide chain release factor subunit 1
MQPDRFRPLAAYGPFASVYFDDSHDTEDAGAQLHVRWKDIASELERQDADPDLTCAVQRAAQERAPAVNIIGLRALLGGYAIHSGTRAMGTPESARGVTPR